MPIPLIIVSQGRSGTTLMVRLLAAHPEIVAHTAYPCELQLLTFAFFRNHPVGGNPKRLEFFRFDGDEELVYRPLARGEPYTATSIRAAYQRIGKNLGKAPRYFVEKSFPDIDLEPIVTTFPDLRFIDLRRDPRDVLMSARAFDARRSCRGFRERDGDSDETVVLEYRRVFEVMARNLTKAPYHVIRYEDLILKPKPALASLLDWLGLASSTSIVSLMLETIRGYEIAHHRTASSEVASIGRWRREMSPSLQALYAVHLGDFLKYHGYD